MAFGYYMNMERLSLEIAKEHINLMEDNIQDVQIEEFLDIDKTVTNIKNGFVAITQLIIFIESFFNTVITTCMLNKKELFLKMSIDEKLELICMYYRKDATKIKSIHYWETFKKMNKIRNELVHYKNSFLCDSTGIQDFNIANTSIRNYFVKSNMVDIMKQVIQLGNHIANILNLKINKEVNIIECDAKDGLVSYVFDSDIVDIDPDRKLN